MTFIAVRCPHCQSDQIVKRGKTARGTQRYLCQNTLWVVFQKWLWKLLCL
jgi:ribosomal protein S27E